MSKKTQRTDINGNAPVAAMEATDTVQDGATYHVPVLLRESVDGMNIGKGGVFIDVTFGGGGHSREVVSRLDDAGRLFSFDQDADAERNALTPYPTGEVTIHTAEGDEKTVSCLADDPRWTFVRSNFRYLKNWMQYHDVEGVDAILADLGVSSHHFDDESRGFSFRYDAPLDMRMNNRGGKTAADILNEYSEEQIADILYLYGELKQSRKIAAAIARKRSEAPIRTTQDLLNATERCFPREREKKEVTKMFQALRIEVNHEMEALRRMLMAAQEVLKPGGRLVVITYHSLEDRMVKNIMKTGNIEGRQQQDFFGRIESPYRLITSKPIVPTKDEEQRNPRSRSAKLRIAEKR